MDDPRSATPPTNSHIDHPRGRRVLADEVRRLVRATRTNTVDQATRDRAVELLQEAALLLEQEQTPGPFWQTGRTSFDGFQISSDALTIFPFSPAMGPLNPVAPVVELEVDDDKTVHGTVTFTEPYNGPPFDTAHGGIIALVYDDLVGMAAMVGAGGGMTANLSIDYRKPTPMFRRIELTARLDRYEGRKFWAHGEMRLDGELLNEASGLFIRPQGFPPLVSTG